MTNILYHNYFYRYREARKQIKAVADTANYVEAKTRLDALIAEHESNYPILAKDFNFGERLMMEHAQRHLQTVIDKNDPEFVDMNGNIGHQSDIAKEALLQVPKTDYSAV